MKTHRIIAATWQLEAAQKGILSAVIVPFPEVQETSNTWFLKWGGIDRWWYKHETPGQNVYNAIDWQIGDRIYLDEEWCKGNWGGTFDDDIYFTRSTTPEAEHIGWQPAHTMPEAAATHWYKVTGVRVVQMAKLTLFEVRTAGLFNPLTDDLFDFNFTTESRWNAAHPDRHWDESRWVVVMDIKEVGKCPRHNHSNLPSTPRNSDDSQR